ncbi:MAG TPA: helix-turn-helix domain-containing protein [Gammaproteobacteria bacterium]|nr:helix-turn-helix domain-containing protein [Gammaproteobacteria bacterium]
MGRFINKEALHSARAELGWTQSQLAKAVGVSSQSVTNWIKGKDFPRPATLLKLATTLKLGFDQLVTTLDEGQPVVAFRKKGGAKTTAAHISKAEGIGMLLKPLVPHLPELQALRTLITSPSTDYTNLQLSVSQTRTRLGLGEQAVLKYEHLIGEFNSCGAVLVPVLKGAKKSHENALHIRLPQEDVTFIFLNLDTRLEDFKFWMAHELAHVYTPGLAGTNEGEDFADAFAGALLFPKVCAKQAYHEAMKAANINGAIKVLQQHASEHMISLNTAYQQITFLTKSIGLPSLHIEEKTIHAVRNSNHGPLVSAALFDPMPPEPKRYMATCEHLFRSDFFNALKHMIHENGTGASYIQQILDTSLQDATALHEAMNH